MRTRLRRSLSKRAFRHYAGFAAGQRREWENTGRRSAKKLLYVLRTALTGTHLLRAGEVVTDVTALLPRYGLDEAVELVEQKRRGEKAELSDALSERWAARVAGVFEKLEQAHRESALPDEPANTPEVEAWLVDYRRGRLR